MYLTLTMILQYTGIHFVFLIGCFLMTINLTPAIGQDYAAPSTISPQAQKALAEFNRAAVTAPLHFPLLRILKPGNLYSLPAVITQIDYLI